MQATGLLLQVTDYRAEPPFAKSFLIFVPSRSKTALFSFTDTNAAVPGGFAELIEVNHNSEPCGTHRGKHSRTASAGYENIGFIAQRNIFLRLSNIVHIYFSCVSNSTA